MTLIHPEASTTVEPLCHSGKPHAWGKPNQIKAAGAPGYEILWCKCDRCGVKMRIVTKSGVAIEGKRYYPG